MGDKKPLSQQVLELERLGEPEGPLAILEKSLAGVEGTIQKLDATLSASTFSLKGVQAISKIFGDLPEQMINYSEELRKSVAGNEEFIASMGKTDRKSTRLNSSH